MSGNLVRDKCNNSYKIIEMLNEKFIYMSSINFSAVEVQLSPKSSLVFPSLLPVPTPQMQHKGTKLRSISAANRTFLTRPPKRT